MSGIIGVSPDMRSGIVGKYPGKIASDTYSVGGHILQSWYRTGNFTANGTDDPNVSAEVLSCTCTGGNFLDCTAIGGYVGTGSTRDTQYIGIRFVEAATSGSPADYYCQRYEILSAYVSGAAQMYYTIPGSVLTTVTIFIVNRHDGASDPSYWTFDTNYPLQMICHEIQG
jgi:hypothetical protein